MDWRIEVIVVPVSDVDRSKAVYADQVGSHVDVDDALGQDFRNVQLTPPGSACSIVRLAARRIRSTTLPATRMTLS